MKAHKLASGRWRCQIYLGKTDGKPIRESVTADTRKEAEIRAAMRLKEFQGIKSRMNVKNAVSAYIRSRESVLSASTIAGYVSIARRSFHLFICQQVKRNFFKSFSGIKKRPVRRQAKRKEGIMKMVSRCI